MGKASKTKQDSSRREKIAAQRAAERRQERRNRLLIAGSAVAVVVIIVVAFIVVKANNKGSPAAGGATPTAPSGSTLTSVISKLTTVPTSATDAVGSGGSQVIGKPQTVTGQTALTANGKPEMLYVGAEYCPYCAAERWSMILALSRFGTFAKLTPIHSAAKNGSGQSEVYPNTPTWTFYGSSYTSQYLTFTPVEVNTNVGDASTGGYTTLQNMTSAQNSIFTKLDAPPYVPSGDNGSFPFVDFGNRYLITGASYSPQVLAGLSWSQIAADLTKSSSPVAQGIDGAANYITAAICKMTNDQPATACTSTVQGLQSQI
jgi:Domain of unknown function (DUF929)